MKPLATMAALGLTLAATVALAQPPQGGPAPKEQRQPLPPSGGRNLQVLPQSILQRNLINTMQAFTSALGVSCNHCHVPGDFASDANPKKEIARGMMRMTWQLNNQTLPAIQGIGQTRVSCGTCHRGAAVPSLEPRPTPPGALPKQ